MTPVEFLFYAVCIVESNLDSTAVGRDNDRGIAQITPILERDYLQRTGEIINPFSTKDSEKVFSPLGGIGSEGYQALKMKRKSISIELKDSYFNLNVRNHRGSEEESRALELF